MPLTLHEDIDHCLLAGYCCALVLLVAYFLFESGPCHGSRRREGVYIAVVLGLIYAVSVLWSEGRHESPDFNGVFRIRQIMRLVLMYRLVQRFVLPDAHPKFHDRVSSRVVLRQQSQEPSSRAQRRAAELDSLIEEISRTVSCSAVAGSPTLCDRMFEPLLFSMLMLEDIMWAFKSLSRSLDYPLLLLLILLPLPGLLHSAKQCGKLRRLTGRVHQLLMETVDRRAADVLQHMLASVRVGTLVEVLRSETVRRFTERALESGLLCTLSKAVLVDALQMRGIRFNKCAQCTVRCLILSCQGEELTLLKNLIDGSCGYHNLHKLVYIDMTNSRLRKDVLRHFADHAVKVRMKLGQAAGVKVLSDIDDTLHSSGGMFPAGCDGRFPRHAVYPGFLALLRVLDKQHDATAGTPTCNVVFLSARPHLYKDVAEDKSYQQFRRLVLAGHLHSFPTLLPGRIRDGLRAVLCYAWSGARAWQAVGCRKYTLYRAYRDLYQEYDYIFCGDNGQGDLLAGQLMFEEQTKRPQGSWEQDALVPKLLCVLIHRVVPDSACLALEPIGKRGTSWHSSLRQKGILLHESYIGAALALHAFNPKLVTVDQLASITSTAIEEFDAVRWANADWGQRWARAEETLRRDLELARDVLQAHGRVPLPHLRPMTELLASPRGGFMTSLSSSLAAATEDLCELSPASASGDAAQWPGSSCWCGDCVVETLDGSDLGVHASSSEADCRRCGSPKAHGSPAPFLAPASPAKAQPAVPDRRVSCLAWCCRMLRPDLAQPGFSPQAPI